MVTIPEPNIEWKFRCGEHTYKIYFTSADQWVVSDGDLKIPLSETSRLPRSTRTRIYWKLTWTTGT